MAQENLQMNANAPMKHTGDKRANAWREGVLDAVPIGISLVLFGAIYGMLSLQAGLTAWESMGMSLIVYAGSAQFTALPLIKDGASMFAIILATFLLNSRHLLMGLSVSPYYKSFSPWIVNVTAFFLTDEQYAITLNRFRSKGSQSSYVMAVSLSLYVAWAFGTWLGIVAGKWIPDPEALGLGFSFTAMFLALAYYQLNSWLRITTFLLCGSLATGLTFVLPNGLHLLAAGLLAFGIGYLLPENSQEDEEQQEGADEA